MQNNRRGTSSTLNAVLAVMLFAAVAAIALPGVIQPGTARAASQAQPVAEWTVLVYVVADNNLESAALEDLNEMEAVGSSADVHIVAQVDRVDGYTSAGGDWTGARRYYIEQDNDPGVVTSPLVQRLGEVNSAAADTLANFVTWGITSYPAQRYMLVLWDHGGAWISHASDETNADDISLPELQSALDRGLAATEADRFEVIGFDMCLMGQLEVYQAVAPFARYAVASEENEPNDGWYYAFLDELVREPTMRGDTLSTYVVVYFMDFLRQMVGDSDVYGLAAVDLGRIGTLTTAVDGFEAAVAAATGAAMSPITDARNNTIMYGGFDDPQVQDFWSSVDLYQFANLLAELDPPPDVRAAADAIRAAVTDVVLYEDHVASLDGSHGVSIYFPMNADVFDMFAQRYQDEVPRVMEPWAAFLNQFHGAALVAVTAPPQVTIQGVTPDVASIHEPAVVQLDIAGRDIIRVSYMLKYFPEEPGGDHIVLDTDTLVSRTVTPSGTAIIDWSDGVTTRTFQWAAEVSALSDGNTTTYALLIPNRDRPSKALVNGVYRSVRGGEHVAAQLIVDLNTQQATALWGLNETASGDLQPFELGVEAGDTFTPDRLALDADNELRDMGQGETLTLSDSIGLRFERVPAPSGTYALGFVAENVTGASTLAETTVTVENADRDPALRGFTELTYDVRFLYPADWIRPRLTENGRLFTANLATDTVLSLMPYRNVDSAAATDAAIRASWDDLDNLVIMQSRAMTINGLPARLTDYTYDYRGEARVGAVIAIYAPGQGVGYAFDLDGPTASPGPAQMALSALTESITFLEPDSAGDEDGQDVAGDGIGESAWQTVTLLDGQVSFPVPATWQAESSGGWSLYGPPNDARVFIALGSDPATGQTNAEVADIWLAQLQEGVEDFNVLASEPYHIGGRKWHTVVFTYQADVPMGGALFTTSVGERDVIFWIEAPDAQFDQLFSDVFAVALGGFAFEE